MSTPLLLGLAIVIVLGIAAQWLAWRLRIASILLLLIAGFAAGPATGLLEPDALLGDLLLPFVSLAVAMILYEGGLTLRFRDLREAGGVVWRLITLGAAATWVLSAFGAWLLAGLSPALSVLLGAVLVVTGPTVIVPLLRVIRPTGRIGAILKWEGIVIDPIGAILAVLVFEVIHLGSVEEAAPTVAAVLLKTIVIGGGFGFGAGMLLALLLRWFWVPDFLDNPVSVMFVIGAYTGAHYLQPESGLLAATVMGITLANQKLVDVKHILEFKENLRVLLISTLFILLAASLELKDLDLVGWGGVALVVVVVVLIRPISVIFATLGSTLSRSEIAFLSVVGPRGIVAAAVASVFALKLEAQGYVEARALVPLTFAVIIGTVLSASIAAPAVAHRLGLADRNPQGVLWLGAHAWGRAIAEALHKLGIPVLMVDTNRENQAAARMAGLRTYGESILAEHAVDEMDLGGIGKLISATPNDWVNVLAVQRFSRIFPRAEVYQVPPARDEATKEAHRHLHGRWLFGDKVNLGTLAGRIARKAVVKATPITEQFTYTSFRERYGDGAIPLFVVTESKRLVVVTADRPADPKAGETLVSLVDEEELGVGG